MPLLDEDRPVRFWPFDGTLDDLLGEPGPALVIVETYPAEFYGHLGLSVATKRSQAVRRACAKAVFEWAEEARVDLSDPFQETVRNGFGSAADGEDPFDAAVGLCGMLNVVLGRRDPGQHPESSSEAVEGWILGQIPRKSPNS